MSRPSGPNASSLPGAVQRRRPARWLIALGPLWLALAWQLAAAAHQAPPRDPLAALGSQLLAERRLAASASRACLDCHIPGRGFTDGQVVATADGLNTPTLWGLADRSTFGWRSPDVATLEAFVLRPLANPREMGPLSEATLERLRADPGLRGAYAAAFPGSAQPVTWEHTARALAAAIRAIPRPPPPPTTAAAARGAALFAELGCAGCHRGPAMGADASVATGLTTDGRSGGQVRVPSLVGLALTGPYLHDGSAATLEEVVRRYQRGGLAPAEDSPIAPFLLSDDELRDLLAFLKAL